MFSSRQLFNSKLGTSQAPEIALELFLSVLLAMFTYVFIEKPLNEINLLLFNAAIPTIDPEPRDTAPQNEFCLKS